ncbi:MAG: OmpH family outer membrane protein [Porphyrobacter sp.]|nr:OmpH family outer membrane protein [Porphyrobacter sp.]
MKNQLIATAALALAVVASPASAQVNGIAVAEPAIAIAASQALQTAFGQIATTYQAQRTQLEQLQVQRQTALKQFDTNNDGQLSEAEQTAAQSNSAARTQLEGLDQQINQVQAPITQARVYALEQVAQQFGPAVQQVVTQHSLQLILSPGQAVYASQAADVTDDIATALNTLVPTVSTTAPAGWRPQQQTISLYQEVQQVLVQAAMAQQAQQQQAAQPQAAQPQGR